MSKMHSSIRECITETYKHFESNPDYIVEVVRVRDRGLSTKTVSSNIQPSSETRSTKGKIRFMKVSTDRALVVESDGDTWRFNVVLIKNLMPDVGGHMAQLGANIHDTQRELQKKDPSLRLTRIYASRVFNVTVPKAIRGQNFIGDIGSGRYIFSARLLRGGADVLIKFSSVGGHLGSMHKKTKIVTDGLIRPWKAIDTDHGAVQGMIQSV